MLFCLRRMCLSCNSRWRLPGVRPRTGSRPPKAATNPPRKGCRLYTNLQKVSIRVTRTALYNAVAVEHPVCEVWRVNYLTTCLVGTLVDSLLLQQATLLLYDSSMLLHFSC